jgi:Uma2 family endonuclease
LPGRLYTPVMAVDPARRRATYADLCALPENLIGEIIDGELEVQPRPAFVHARATTALSEEIGPPFDRGKGGPGGWIILFEPELHLGEDVIVPDLGGWRRERMPELPDVAWVDLAPDWVCEVLSPKTALLDRRRKLPIYAREAVGHVWLVDPALQSLEIFRLDGDSYRLRATYGGSELVRAEPFDAIELDLAALWMR